MERPKFGEDNTDLCTHFQFSEGFLCTMGDKGVGDPVTIVQIVFGLHTTEGNKQVSFNMTPGHLTAFILGATKYLEEMVDRKEKHGSDQG